MGRLDEAFKLFFRNPIPSDTSFYLKLLDLCIEARANKHGRLIHAHLFYNGFESNLTLNTKMIIFYSKVGDMGNAHTVFDKMPERNIVSWTALLSGYSQNGFFKDALMVFQNMHHSGLKCNQFTYGSALRACTKLMCLRSGKQIQGCLQKSRFVGNVFVQSALVDLHSKCGDIEDASYVFKMMHERDLVCWNAMIGGYSVQGFPNYAFGVFQSMLREDLFARGGQLKEAVDLMQNMNIPLTASLWSAILSASNVYGDMSLGKVAAKCLLDLDGENSAPYVALASAYAAVGLWDDSQVIHELMELKKLKKSPGLSLVLSPDKRIEVLQG